MKIDLKKWREDLAMDVFAFEAFWKSHKGEENFPDELPYMGDWDEQFDAWRNSK